MFGPMSETADTTPTLQITEARLLELMEAAAARSVAASQEKSIPPSATAGTYVVRTNRASMNSCTGHVLPCASRAHVTEGAE